jgi:hypothetical protein
VLGATGSRQPEAGGLDVVRTWLGPPDDWTGIDAPTGGIVLIPDHIDPTNPRRVYDLDNTAECKYLYEIVLADGTPTDINELINQTLLARLWDGLYLPRDVRAAWADAISQWRSSAQTDSGGAVNRITPELGCGGCGGR